MARRIFWYLPSAPVQGARVEMPLKPQKQQCEGMHSEEAVGLKQPSCFTAAGQHCMKAPATCPGSAPGRQCAASAVLAASWKQLHFKIS